MRIIKQNLYIKFYPNGEWYTCWFKNNAHHREDGPSVMWYDKVAFYNLEGDEYSSIDYWKEIHANY